MEAVQGSLTILNPHAPTPQVFWNGQLVNVIGVTVVNDGVTGKVTIKVPEDTVLAEMQAAGIKVVRG